jgi:hypothetical protein
MNDIAGHRVIAAYGEVYGRNEIGRTISEASPTPPR